MEDIRYKEFVNKVLKPLSNDAFRRDKEKVKKLLIDYFKKEQFTVYSFVHYYFNNPNHRKSELNCTKEIVKEVLDDLILSYENCICETCKENGKFGEEIASSCETRNCINKQFANVTNEQKIFQCVYREKYYHVIRRIAKFYENLHSVDNLTEVNKSIKEIYSRVVDSLKDDVNEFRTEAFEQTKCDIGKIEERIKNNDESLSAIDESLSDLDESLSDIDKRLSETTERSNEITKELEGSKQEILINMISVLSIFSAVLLATIVPMNLLNAITKQVFEYAWDTELIPILIFTVIMFVMFNLIYFLISYVATITLGERCNVLFASKRRLVYKINAILLIFISISFLSVLFL